MKLILENWRRFLSEAEDYKPEIDGNCGMVAIAMLELAAQRGIDNAKVVLVHNAAEYGVSVRAPPVDPHGDYELVHVVVQIGNRYFDDRGEISKKEITILDGEDLLDPSHMEVYEVEVFDFDPVIRKAIIHNTDPRACPADFKKRAEHLLSIATQEPEAKQNSGALKLT